MKLLHTGDLHIGKSLCDMSMLEDQEYILNQLVHIAVEESADAVIIAGDVYDRAVPPAEAVVVLDRFLTSLVHNGIKVMMISGNHDSPERVGFADRLLEASGIYIAGECQEGLKQVVLQDEEGEVVFILAPFEKPSAVSVKSNAEAVAKRLSGITLKDNVRNVLITHYFVTNQGKAPLLSDAETTIHVGGLDDVEASLFADFDYVALGHIHRQQQVGEGPIYYAGAPLQYSFSEAGKIKTVTMVNLSKKNALSVEQIPLQPRRQLRCIRGRLKDLIQPEVLSQTCREDYIQALLTDDDALIDPIGTLRTFYPNIMQIQLLKNEETASVTYRNSRNEKKKEIPELFSDFYEMIRGNRPDEVRMKVIVEMARTAGREEG